MSTDMNVNQPLYPGVIAEPALEAASMAALAKADKKAGKGHPPVTTERVSTAADADAASADFDLDPPIRSNTVSVAEVMQTLYRLQMELRKDRSVNRWFMCDQEMAELADQANQIREGAETAKGLAIGALCTQTAFLATAAGYAGYKAFGKPSAASAKQIEGATATRDDYKMQSSTADNKLLEYDNKKMPELEAKIEPNNDVLRGPSATYKESQQRFENLETRFAQPEHSENKQLFDDYAQQRKPLQEKADLCQKMLSAAEDNLANARVSDQFIRSQGMFLWSQLLAQMGSAPAQFMAAMGDYSSKNAQANATDAEAAAKKASYTRQEQADLYQEATKAMEEVRNILGQIISEEAKTMERILS